jgi:hypothetical protein
MLTRVALLLGSDEASYVKGSVLALDLGRAAV